MKKTYSLYFSPSRISFFTDTGIFLFRTLHHLFKKVIAVSIDADHQWQVVKFDRPDRFSHAEIFKEYFFYRHV